MSVVVEVVMIVKGGTVIVAVVLAVETIELVETTSTKRPQVTWIG